MRNETIKLLDIDFRLQKVQKFINFLLGLCVDMGKSDNIIDAGKKSLEV
jgi:hypothetical protein